MKKMNVKKFARTFLVLIAVFALACAFSSMAFAADGETAAAAPDNNMGIGMIAAALAVGFAGIGAGIAVGSGAPSAIGARSISPRKRVQALSAVSACSATTCPAETSTIRAIPRTHPSSG